MNRLLDYRFGPRERSGDQGKRGTPMFSVRQVLMLPAIPVFGIAMLVAAPRCLGAGERAQKWHTPFIVAGAFFGAIACAMIDVVWGVRPRWDFKDQCSLLGLELRR